MEQSHREYESSFSLAITNELANVLIQNYAKVKKIIYYYINGDRFDGKRFQKKITQKTKGLLKICRFEEIIYFIPITRKVSIETLTEPTLAFQIETMIVRQILYEGNGVRISVEKRANVTGGTFYITGEVEYTESIYYNFDQLQVLELYLIDRLFIILKPHLDLFENDALFKPKTILIEVKCRVFQKLSQYINLFANNKILFKHKYDGFRARLTCTARDEVTYYDDIHNSIVFTSGLLNAFPNIIFQCEFITINLPNDERKNFLVFTDIIGGYVNHYLYMPDSPNVVKMFECK